MTQSKEERVHQVFETIYKRYDVMNSVISFQRHKSWRKDTMKRMAVKEGMTTEPKFVPNQAVSIHVDDGLDVNIRLVDCVGYAVPGAKGYEDENGPRMINTPWYEEPIPFQEAAEIGTRKVIQEHSTLGVVITTDGSIMEDIVLVVPTKAVRSTVQQLRELLTTKATIVHASKGIEPQTHKRISEMIAEEMADSNKLADIVVLSGPSHAI